MYLFIETSGYVSRGFVGKVEVGVNPPISISVLKEKVFGGVLGANFLERLKLPSHEKVIDLLLTLQSPVIGQLL